MANKKKVSDFENALLSNTKVIKKEPEKKVSQIKSQTTNESYIDSDLLEKIEALSKEQGVETKELISLALNHFINMKSVFFE